MQATVEPVIPAQPTQDPVGVTNAAELGGVVGQPHPRGSRRDPTLVVAVWTLVVSVVATVVAIIHVLVAKGML